MEYVLITIGSSQPTDSEILNSNGLDVVFDALAGVVSGDNLLPVE
jgi:hypothetical protein